MLTNKRTALLLIFCATNLALAVAMGAFAAHGLKPILSEYKLSVFQKACEYLSLQSIGVMLLLVLNANVRLKSYIPIMLLLGTYIFSISISLTAFSELDGYSGLSKAGIVAPIGGLMMILSWILAAIGFFKSYKKL